MIVLQSLFIIVVFLIAAWFCVGGTRIIYTVFYSLFTGKSKDYEFMILALIMGMAYIAMGTWIYITFIP